MRKESEIQKEMTETSFWLNLIISYPILLLRLCLHKKLAEEAEKTLDEKMTDRNPKNRFHLAFVMAILWSLKNDNQDDNKGFIESGCGMFVNVKLIKAFGLHEDKKSTWTGLFSGENLKETIGVNPEKWLCSKV
jgi:hypothetical protein